MIVIHWLTNNDDLGNCLKSDQSPLNQHQLVHSTKPLKKTDGMAHHHHSHHLSQSSPSSSSSFTVLSTLLKIHLFFLVNPHTPTPQRTQSLSLSSSPFPHIRSKCQQCSYFANKLLLWVWWSQIHRTYPAVVNMIMIIMIIIITKKKDKDSIHSRDHLSILCRYMFVSLT